MTPDPDHPSIPPLRFPSVIYDRDGNQVGRTAHPIISGALVAEMDGGVVHAGTSMWWIRDGRHTLIGSAN